MEYKNDWKEITQWVIQANEPDWVGVNCDSVLPNPLFLNEDNVLY